MNPQTSPSFDDMARDAILAGLRLLQLTVEGQVPWPRGSHELQRLYTNEDNHGGLDTGDIDDLCERINTEDALVIRPDAFDHAELATLRAALRHYLDSDLGDPAERDDDVHELATDCDLVTSLDDAGIEGLDGKLCELLQALRQTPQQQSSSRPADPTLP